MQKDSWEKIGLDLIKMSESLSMDCQTCDYWKGQIRHDKDCLTQRAKALRAKARKKVK